jgi:hypothetical protein
MKLHHLYVKYDKLQIKQYINIAGMPTGGDGAGGAPAIDPNDNSDRGVVLRTFTELFHGLAEKTRGVDIKDLVATLSGRMSEVQVRAIVNDDLIGDGTIYATLDDDHYAFTL